MRQNAMNYQIIIITHGNDPYYHYTTIYTMSKTDMDRYYLLFLRNALD